MVGARIPMIVLAVVGAAVLAACAPAVREVARPVVVVVAGPTERPLEGVDAALREALLRAGFTGSFGPAVVRAIAERRNLSEAQALTTTAELGRIGGGDAALYVNVSRLEREAFGDRPGFRRTVIVRLQLRATLVDPATGALLWSTRDVLREGVRIERVEEELPSLRSDPTALALRDAAARALAREAVVRLADLDR